MADYENCPKCDVAIGGIHTITCGVSRCKQHGIQRISCDLPGGHAPTKFTGYWPGTEEAIERGWYSYLDPINGWTRCDKDHEDGSPDLNRVAVELTWNSTSEKFE